MSKLKINQIVCLLSLICLVLSPFLSYAQRNKKDSKAPTEGYVNVGVQAGVAYYVGDLYINLTMLQPAGGAFISRKLSPHLYGRIGLNVSHIAGDDSKANNNSPIFARNLHFRNQIIELNGNILIDLIGSKGKFYKRTNFSPYILAGVSIFHHNPQAKIPKTWGNAWIDLQPLSTEGQGRFGYAKPYSKVQFALPLGLGLRFKMNDRVDINIEACLRYTYTDYLDDVSGQYPEMSDLGNPLSIMLSNRTLEAQSATTGQNRNLTELVGKYGINAYLAPDNNIYQTLGGFQRDTQFSRGNGFNKDFFVTFQMQVAYIMNVGLKCPKFR